MYPLPSQIFLDLSPLPETEQHLRSFPVCVTAYPTATDEVREHHARELDFHPWESFGLAAAFSPLLPSQALQLGDVQGLNGTMNVKGYRVPSLAEEGIINMLLFISPVARLTSLAHSEAGTSQLVPLNQTGANWRKSVTLCFALLYFQILFPLSEGVGKSLFKEQRKRKRVVGRYEEKKEKRRQGWVGGVVTAKVRSI